MEEIENNKYKRAKKKMEEIKGFYSHLVVYIIVNVLLLLVQMGVFSGNWGTIGLPSFAYFTTPFFWGIGLTFHGLYVFQHKFRFFKDWEERKIKEYMDKDDEDFRNSTKWN
ncbi:MAG: 2TM domain-containing protein [Bacteroidota bacterium]